jgi:hypothetical protein
MKNKEWTSKLVPLMDEKELIDTYYLDIRSALLEAAAFFDRLDRSEKKGTPDGEERVSQLKMICRIVEGDEADRVSRILGYLSVKEDV